MSKDLENAASDAEAYKAVEGVRKVGVSSDRITLQILQTVLSTHFVNPSEAEEHEQEEEHALRLEETGSLMCWLHKRTHEEVKVFTP